MKSIYSLIVAMMCVFHVDHFVAQNLAPVAVATSVGLQKQLPKEQQLPVLFGNTITSAELKKHLEILASDAYEGRETGMPGQKKAAQYLADYYASQGIAPCNEGSYFQQYPLKKETYTRSKAVVDGNTYNFADDFYCWGGEWKELNASDLVFVGYGIMDGKYTDYTAGDVKGKVMLCLSGEPHDKKGMSLITGTEANSDWADDYGLKYETAIASGAKGMVVIQSDYQSIIQRIRYWLENAGARLDYPVEAAVSETELPLVFISPKLANQILTSTGKSSADWVKKIEKKKKFKAIKVKTDLKFELIRDAEKFTAENVLCFIEGTDPVLKNEVVIISAHYDHIGIVKGEINNGADDDGSGTVSTLEIAQAFIEAKKQGHGSRRSILILNVSGEEKGLLGSEWYAEYPIFPRESTVVDLNIDMIGRKDDAHPDPNYVYLIGSDKLSTDLHKISEKCNTTYTNLALDYTYNDPEDPNRFYYRSDHYNFAKFNIPVIFYFSGVHEDYHKPGDDVEKILFDKMETIARLVFYTAWEVANRDERLKVDVVNDFEGK